MRLAAFAVLLASTAAVAVIPLTGCSPFSAGAFTCTDDGQCDLTGGVCEPNGLCSFTDPSCTSGRRYGDRSGSLSGVCVGDEPTDGGAGGDGGPCVEWPQPALHFDSCAVGAPPGTPLAAPTFEAGVSTLDTDSGVLTTPGGTSSFTLDVVAQTSGPDIAVFFFASFDLPAASTLRVTGSRALLIASDATMTIGGDIDVTSERAQVNPAAGTGFVDHCLGARDADGNSGGGGGGGLGSVGGAGGAGNGEVNTGGDAGDVVALGDRILPGCPGGIGHDRAGAENPLSAGGLGGGAVQLSARTSISVSGTALIAAGGMGGGASNGNGTGGGGGGSGGFIGFDSQSVVLDALALLLANGGGGGEGSGAGNPGDPGDDAQRAGVIASGGAGGSGSGGDGGDGGFSGAPGVTGLGSATNGGGGGGGGLGAVICRGCP